MPSRSSAALLVALAACHRGAVARNTVAPREGLTLSVYDAGNGTFSEVVDDRRWIELAAGAHELVLTDLDVAAPLGSLVLESGDLELGACHRALADGRVLAATVTCEAKGAPGKHLVRVLYVTSGIPYRAQHEVRMQAADRATLRSTYLLTTPRWHRTAQTTIFDGAPGGERIPTPLAHGEVALDGTVGAIVVPPREVKGRLRRVFEGAIPIVGGDIPQSDLSWAEASQTTVWMWLELADARVPPGPVDAILDLPNERARVANLSGDRVRTPVDGGPTRLAIYADEELLGHRQRWHDFTDHAELADRFVIAVGNTGDEPREVWIEEKLRTNAKRRSVVRAWPTKPGLHGDTLRSKVTVRPGKTERVGYTIEYDF